jgi:hypothetical protein
MRWSRGGFDGCSINLMIRLSLYQQDIAFGIIAHDPVLRAWVRTYPAEPSGLANTTA